MSLHEKRIQNIQLVLVAFSAGGLLGGAFFHLLPEAFESIEDPTIVSMLLVTGIISLFITTDRGKIEVCCKNLEYIGVEE